MSSKLDAFNYNHALIDITSFRYAKAPDIRPKREMPRVWGAGAQQVWWLAGAYPGQTQCWACWVVISFKPPRSSGREVCGCPHFTDEELEVLGSQGLACGCVTRKCLAWDGSQVHLAPWPGSMWTKSIRCRLGLKVDKSGCSPPGPLTALVSAPVLPFREEGQILTKRNQTRKVSGQSCAQAEPTESAV